MSVQITIGKMSKRINSTKQTFTADPNTTNMTVVLKDPCAMTSPVFQVRKSNFASSGFYNYMSWGSWYYWIDEIIYTTNDIWEIHTHLDALATFKSAIQNTYGLVVYGNKANHNIYADDIRFSPEKLFRSYSPAAQNLFNMNFSKQGSVIMTFTQTCSVDWMNPTPSGQTIPGCGIHTALMSLSAFNACIKDLKDFDLMAGWSGDGAMEIVQAFQRLIQSTGGGSLMDNIMNAIWLPFTVADIKTAIGSSNYQTRTGMMLGGVLSMNIEWYEISNNFILNKESSISYTINDLIKDPNDATVKYWFLRNNRFLSLQVATPGGYTNVPIDIYKYDPNASDTVSIYSRSSLNITSGEWSLKLSKSSTFDDTLASFSGCMGINITGLIYNGSLPSGMIADAGAGIVAGALSMGIGGVAKGIMTGEKMQTLKGYSKEGLQHYATTLNWKEADSGITGDIPQTNFNPAQPSGTYGGSVTSMFLTPNPGKLTCRFECWAPENIITYYDYCDKYGYPVNKYMKLDTISGYVKCAGASVEAEGASEAMISTLNSFVNSGIYIE